MLSPYAVRILVLPPGSLVPLATFLSDRRYHQCRASEDIWRGQRRRSRVDLVCGIVRTKP
jgi:hypothetical protein